ncbi:MAG: IPT/TIG domain-containing protein [Dehalococcoidales bacterium]|nr:IPT/TIG domain-containing protein [Dehalococcoidales bacterium]
MNKTLFARKLVLILFSVFSIIFTIWFGETAVSASGTSISVSPAAQSVANGATFTFDLKMNTSTAFLGWQADINFDAAKMQCNSVTLGSWFSNYVISHGGVIWTPGSPVIDNNSGHITNLAVGGLNVYPGLTGEGILCTISFTAKPSVNSIGSVIPVNVKATADTGNPISNIGIISGLVFIGNITPPSISLFSPSSAASGEAVTISGSNFTGTSSVQFGGVEAQTFDVLSDTEITAVVGSGSSGAVSVTTPGGTGTKTGFIFLSAPVISYFTPTSGGQSALIIINGNCLTGSTAVSFGGIPAASFSIDSDEQITAVLGSGASGVVSVTNSYGTGTLEGFNFIPPPVISGFSPSMGGKNSSITISGVGFTGATAVTFGDVPAGFTVVSDTQINATVSDGSTGAVSVTTQGGITAMSGFTFIPEPVISSFTPDSGGGGALVTINGNYLETVTEVSFGGTLAQTITFISDTQLIVTVGTGATGPVSVTTLGGTVNSNDSFTFILPPTITFFSPAWGTNGTTVTITGTSLSGASSVNFGGTPGTIISNNDTQLVAVVGSGSSGNVSVTTPGGTATKTGFTFYGTPTITSFSPQSGTTGASIIITGTGFNGATSVTFGGVSASTITVNSDTQITATVGSGATGAVSVTGPGGTGIKESFTYVAPSGTVSFNPNPLSIIKGDSFEIDLVIDTSTGFLAWQSEINFDASRFQCTGIQEGDFLYYYALNNGGLTVPIAASVIDNVNGKITGLGYAVLGIGGVGRSGSGTLCVLSFTANSNSSGTGTIIPYDIDVYDAYGNPIPNLAISGCQVTVNWPSPVINTFVPIQAGRGDSVTISGTNLNGTTAVSFGSIPAASFTVDSDTQITAVVGSGANGDVTVTTPGGTAVASGFIFIPIWDINRDHVCDVLDAVSIGLHWQETGTVGWIPEDVNQDGILDVLDVVFIGLYWQETW